MRLWIGILSATLLVACERQTAPPEPPSPPPASASVPDRSAWSGRWIGPEGLFLQIDPAGAGRYHLILKDNLDSQATYEAEATAEGLRFVRNGETLTIRQGTGPETGFKWLADKADCLIVAPGREGYCRG
jgi:hypothetical protein